MAPRLTICSQTRGTTSVLLLTSIRRVFRSPLKCLVQNISHRHNHLLRFPRFFLNCALAQYPIDLSHYKEAFSIRMAMAGLKPNHRIALAVSGGPDSMALCVLTANWKTDGPNAVGHLGGFIDGLLAVIVDHGLRAESRDEANLVLRRVSEMGIRCEIAHCDWEGSRPKQGHLQEAARDMRYQMLQNVCYQHQIGVLLVAHHADDQAELFILRLSRNSGVLGLAGMAFTSQIFSSHWHCYCDKNMEAHGILLVRPLLDFSKEDMYKICQGANQDWVEDPTNKNKLFARNRIRMSLGNLPSSIFRSELQAVILACRKTRSCVDKICSDLINQTLTIMDQQGYAVIDLESLNPSEVQDIYLSKFIALVLQFISQRQRPIRGSTSKLLLDFIRSMPCKTSLTAAGCYLCPAPGSKGTKMLVCCSVGSPLPSNTNCLYMQSSEEQKHHIPNELEQIIADGKSFSDPLVPDPSEVQFLHLTSESVLDEAKRLNILSESTYRNIVLLQREENEQFKCKAEVIYDDESKHERERVSAPPSKLLQTGLICCFMDRFLVTWKVSKEFASNILPGEAYSEVDLREESQCDSCMCCLGDEMEVEVRHVLESDWLYLAELSKPLTSKKIQEERVGSNSKLGEVDETNLHQNFVRLSAQRALKLLKTIPVAARRSLPVLFSRNGRLLSIPSVGFRLCPCLVASAVFRPRVPLGRGHSSFI
ncbi:uncharacterized protein LOC110818616 isoform X1 [Carica papaya]|uniref:uncharacterized protein LOC110818616 isoform X1 n=1 Tax=Carica papaya TaxID=3649 RepID=UPI000B8C85E4|nr:uncharacterized protein LOC110818616 isoform X1 [Carica papaya]